MSTVKISQLPNLPSISANTSNTLFLGVNLQTDVTGQFTATTLANQLYANNDLVVGVNEILFSNTIGQFSGYDPNFIQVNLQNFTSSGAGDFIITADTGTNSNSYIDLGINNSQWNAAAYGQTSQYPYDGYLVVQGPGSTTYGNLVIGTAVANTSLVIAVGGQLTNSITAKFTPTSFKTYTPIIFADSTTQSTAAATLAYTQAAYALANTVTANTIYLQGAYNLANTVSSNTVYLQGGLNTANANTVYLQGGLNTANANTVYLQGALNVANIFTQAAFNLANTALQNTASIVIPGNLNLLNGGINVANVNSQTTVGQLRVNGNLIVQGNTLSAWSVAYGATANGNSQATAYPLVTTTTEFTSAPAGTGAILPLNNNGTLVFIANDANTSMKVYPPVGGSIDFAPVNTPFTLSANGMWTGIELSSGIYTTIDADPQNTDGNIVITQGNGNVAYSLASTINVSTINASNTTINNGITTTANVTANALISNNHINYYTITANTIVANTVTISGNTVPTQNTNTWTPSVTWTTGSGTYPTAVGTYIKIGKQVTATFNIVASAVGTGNASLSLSGLPTPATLTNGVVGSMTVSQYGGSVSTTVAAASGSVQSAATSVPIYSAVITGGGGGGNAYRQLTNTDLGATMQISGIITYISAN
jgi:hypothetical protein